MARMTMYQERFVVSLTHDQKAHLESRANHEQVSYSDYLRWLIACDMKKHQRRERRNHYNGNGTNASQ